MPLTFLIRRNFFDPSRSFFYFQSSQTLANPLSDTLTQIGLILATALAGASGVLALKQSRRSDAGESPVPSSPAKPLPAPALLRGLVVGTLVICLAVVAVRWTAARSGSTGGWQPIEVHADGLILMAAMITWCAMWVVRRGRGITLAAFLLFLVAGLNAWAACPANWRPFTTLAPVWHAIHLVGVSLGTAAAAIAAAGGAMYLVAAKRLKQKLRVASPGSQRLSLETLEQIIVKGATTGFVLLTLGLIAGAVMLSREPGAMGGPFYTSIKFWLAVIAWAAYGLLMNARLTPQLRGRYAAWVAIAGFFLLLIVYGIFTVVPSSPAAGGAG